MMADSALVAAVAPSPNHGERREALDMLVLHYTGMASGAAALERLIDPRSEVSAHYFVEEDGRILQLVPEVRRAWHAGAGVWRGAADINSRSIGIEIVNPGHAHGYRAFPAAQVAAVAMLAGDCCARWPIPSANVLAHSDVAPARKEDPGELFPWAELFAAGVGHYVPPVPVGPGDHLEPGVEGDAVRALQRDLRAYGYDLGVTGTFDAATRAVTTAFQRHFRPALVDGIADASTRRTLRRLLDACPDDLRLGEALPA